LQDKDSSGDATGTGHRGEAPVAAEPLPSDYRDFLLQHFNRVRAGNPSFSFQYCARRLKTSKSYLKLVTQRRRHITLSKITVLSDLLKLSEYDRKLLLYLFLRDVAKDAVLSRYFSEVIAKMQSAHSADAALAAGAAFGPLNAGGQWLSAVLMGLTQLHDFKPDVAWMQARLGRYDIPVESIEQCWLDLQSQGKLAAQRGRYQPTGRGPQRGAFFQECSFEDATGRPEICPGFSVSLAVTEEAADWAQAAFLTLRDDLMRTASEDGERNTVLLVSGYLCKIAPVE
jgi:hypothetical protein